MESDDQGMNLQGCNFIKDSIMYSFVRALTGTFTLLICSLSIATLAAETAKKHTLLPLDVFLQRRID